MITERRKINILGKVFSKEDSIRLIAILYGQMSKSEADDHKTFDLSVTDSIGRDYKSDNDEIFNKGGIADTRRLKEIGCSYANYTSNKNIRLTLHEGSIYSDLNCVEISGDDRAWVSEVSDEVRNILDSIQPQGSWLTKHSTITLNLLALAIGSVFVLLITLVVQFLDKPVSDPSESVSKVRSFFQAYPIFLHALNWGLRWFCGFPLAFEVRRWFFKMWPMIEFDFGPEHLKIEKQKRVRIFQFLMLVGLPLFLTLLLDWVKN